MEKEFWKKPLNEMSREEWEALCDCCGLCCLCKIEYEDTSEVCYTNVACRYLNCNTMRCTNYKSRIKKVPDCAVLTPDNINDFFWLPKTCAYRSLAEGRKLPDWHYLISGSEDEVLKQDFSLKGRVISEESVHQNDLENYITDWIKY